MEKQIKAAVALLDQAAKKDHDNCIKEGLKDEFCPKCNRLFLAHYHFVRCENKPCPMSNGKTFLEMLGEVIEKEELNKI